MYKINGNLKEWHLEPSVFYLRFIDVCKSFNIQTYNVQFYSQQDEDKYIIQYLLKEPIKDGTFLEVGGCDGVLFSNTKTLEDHFGFTGILIEPQQEFYSKLFKNRPNCKCYNYAISNSDETDIEFVGDNAEGGIKSLLNTDDSKFPEWQSYKVKNKKMKDIIKDSGLKHIDFMIIDVEGSELEVLKSIDFSFPIFCIIIEADSRQQEKNKIFGEYLKSNGFKFKERQRGNEVWINYNCHRKGLFNV